MIKIWRTHLLVASVLVFAACAASSASAATLLGDKCTATGAFGATAVQTALAPGSTTYTAPADGVITSWGSGFPGAGGYSGKLVILHPEAVANTYTVKFVSDSVPFVGGLNKTAAQIAVNAGDVIGLNATPAATGCGTGNAADAIRYDPAATNPTAGSTVTASSGPTAAYHVAVFANLEADADHDGFGDETQDLCPVNPAVQAVTCPIVKLSKFMLPLSGKSVELLIASNASVPVTVNGSVSIKSAKAKKSSTASTFKVGPVTKTVAPGEVTAFKLKLSKKLLAALKGYPKSKKFKLNLTITGKGLANTDTLKQSVNLKGSK